MYNSGKSEQIIQEVVGCGPFQIILDFILFFVTKSSLAFTMMLMSFGNYNPGWKCLDSNSSFSNDTVLNNSILLSEDYIEDNCPVFESCEHVEFAPGTSTIVSEWGLLCDKAWIPSIIISLQMFGLLIGSSFAGQLGDVVGRKTVLCAAQILLVILNIVCIFASSWQMFAALRFLLGITIACNSAIGYVYLAEFSTLKWRAPLAAIPYWPVLCIAFALTCMWVKDWRHVQIATTVISVVGFVPLLWLPESMRWLEVKNKTDKFEKVAKKIARINGKTLPSLKDMTTETHEMNEESKASEQETITAKAYNFFDLFRRGYHVYTFLLAVPWFSMSLIFYAISFGVKSLSGDIYLNLILLYATEIPFTFIPMIAPNLLGRKIASIAFAGVSGMCLLVAACLQRLTNGVLKATGVIVLVNIGRIGMGAFWALIEIYTVELYPTVIRGLGNSWGFTMARIGGIIAPFLIPNEPSTFFICYIIMGCLALFCCVIITRLPETRGKILKETFQETDVGKRGENKESDCNDTA